MAAWGRALCNAQLIWNAEDVNASLTTLRKQAARPDFPGTMSERERRYFASVQTLNGEPNPPRSEAEAVATRPARFAAYHEAVSALAAAYPHDQTAASFVPFATLALGSVGECASAGSAQCDAYAQLAREGAAAAYKADEAFPGTIHYGMHAHDYPDETIYSGGLVYARAYPLMVRSACHSLHMPSHIFDRAGMWYDASEANGASVAAADAFARLPGALAQMGGPIDASFGFGFAFNAGNVYHSLEYEAYELLQQCRFDEARQRSARMGYVRPRGPSNHAHDSLAARNRRNGPPDLAVPYIITFATRPLSALASPQVVQQALAHAPAPAFRRVDAPDDFSSGVGASWFEATTYLQWELRMRSRQTLWPMLSEMLGAAPPLATADWRAAPWVGLPPPLSWEGRTVYDHGFNSPLAEATAHHAAAMAALYDLQQRGLPLPAIPADEPPTQVCSSIDGCVAHRVRLARRIVEKAEAHYAAAGIAYEGAATTVLLLQLQALANLTLSDVPAALAAAAEAARLEQHANTQLLRPSSTTLLSLPAVALHGALLLRHGTPAEAADAFAGCLEPWSKPQMPLCLLGLARARASLGDTRGAKESYAALLRVWQGEGSQCDDAVREATAYVDGGAPAAAAEQQTLMTAVVVLGGYAVVATLALLALLLLRCRRGQRSAGEMDREEERPSARLTVRASGDAGLAMAEAKASSGQPRL